MTLGFVFHPEARAELFTDVVWYDERESGLGERFEGAVRAAVDAAVDSPESWAAWGDLLVVVAVAHAKRRPGYWRERVLSA